MKEKLELLKSEALKAITEAKDEKQIDEIRIKYLGKKGELTAILKQMGSLAPEERPIMGQLVNKAKSELEDAVTAAAESFKAAAADKKLQAETLDITMPSKPAVKGGLHPLKIVLNDMIDIFQSMGFDVVDGPEV